MASDAPWYNSQVGLQQRDYVRVQPSQQVLVIPKPTQPIILLAQGKSHALEYTIEFSNCIDTFLSSCTVLYHLPGEDVWHAAYYSDLCRDANQRSSRRGSGIPDTAREYGAYLARADPTAYPYS